MNKTELINKINEIIQTPGEEMTDGQVIDEIQQLIDKEK